MVMELITLTILSATIDHLTLSYSCSVPYSMRPALGFTAVVVGRIVVDLESSTQNRKNNLKLLGAFCTD